MLSTYVKNIHSSLYTIRFRRLSECQNSAADKKEKFMKKWGGWGGDKKIKKIRKNTEQEN